MASSKPLSPAQIRQRREAGRKGGRAVVQKYGPDHMSRLGSLGAQALHAKYNLIAYGRTGYALQCRATGTIVATW